MGFANIRWYQSRWCAEVWRFLEVGFVWSQLKMLNLFEQLSTVSTANEQRITTMQMMIYATITIPGQSYVYMSQRIPWVPLQGHIWEELMHDPLRQGLLKFQLINHPQVTGVPFHCQETYWVSKNPITTTSCQKCGASLLALCLWSVIRTVLCCWS